MPLYSKVTRSGQVTLPASVRRKLDIKEGDIIEFAIEDGTARLSPLKVIDRDQAYFWTKEWQEAEKRASQDIKEGRVKTFDSVDELFEDLG